MTYRIKIATEPLEINIRRSFKPDFLVRSSKLFYLDLLLAKNHDFPMVFLLFSL